MKKLNSFFIPYTMTYSMLTRTYLDGQGLCANMETSSFILISMNIWESEIALDCPHKKWKEWKKAMLGGILKSTQSFETRIKGQKGYKETFDQKHEDEIKKKKDFLWIYKG